MVWLIVIQVSWFKEALNVRHQQFSQCVNRSLYRVVQKLEENEVVSHIQNEVIAVNFDSSSRQACSATRPPRKSYRRQYDARHRGR